RYSFHAYSNRYPYISVLYFKFWANFLIVGNPLMGWLCYCVRVGVSNNPYQFG
ncbi:hypothetical protein GIB67_039022, partial [Kingdonia uniflora]